MQQMLRSFLTLSCGHPSISCSKPADAVWWVLCGRGGCSWADCCPLCLQAAPCWPPPGCQASSSCRSWRNWSWPTVQEPRPSSSNTTPSTCPTAWSSSKTAQPSSDRRPYVNLPPQPVLVLFHTELSLHHSSSPLPARSSPVPLCPPPQPSERTPSLAGRLRGRKVQNRTCHVQRHGVRAAFEKTLAWGARCDVLSDSKFLFHKRRRKPLCGLGRRFS